MESGDFLQMDKATPPGQETLGQQRERCAHPNLYRHNNLCTVAIIEKTLNLNRSVYEVLRILSRSLLAKDSITELFTPTREPMPVMSGQLQLEL